MSLSTPTSGDVHINQPLTNFAQQFVLNTSSFVAMTACPNIPVSKQTDFFWNFDREDFFRTEAQERAESTESVGADYNVSTDAYACKVIALHKDISDRTRINADPSVRLELNANRFLMNQMMIKRELLFTSRFLGAGIWTKEVLAGGYDWSQPTSTPIADIKDQKRAILAATGYMPNKMLIGRKAYDTLTENDDVLSRITGGATTSEAAMVQKVLLTQLLELDEISVMDGVNNVAAKGKDFEGEFFNTDDALLYYAPNEVSEGEPTAMVQFSWTGLTGGGPTGTRVKSFRMENLSADRIEAEMAFDYRVISKELACYMQQVSGS